MRISPNWLREFIDLKVEARQLADDLTLAGVAVERPREGVRPVAGLRPGFVASLS